MMLFKVHFLLTTLILSLIATAIIACNQSPENIKSVNQIKTLKNDSIENEQIILTIKDFYKHYINETNYEKDSLTLLNEIIHSIRDKYCSRKLIHLLEKLTYEELSYDPFLEGQMSDSSMLDNLSVRKDRIKANFYYVTYQFGEYKPTIELQMTKEDGQYKINSLPLLDKHLATIDSLQNAGKW